MADTKTGCDIAIIGAGPAGLSLARSLASAGLAVTIVERNPLARIQTPDFDGREIALTKSSERTLRELDAWHRIPAGEISTLASAHVLNGSSDRSLHFYANEPGEALGWLVPNHLICKALYESVATCESITLLTERSATSVTTNGHSASVLLSDGSQIVAGLVVAADTRFSETRRSMGISSRMRDFGKTMLVCRVWHERPHDGVATEWFGYDHTIAALPLNDDPEGRHQSGLVVTMDAIAISRLMAMKPEDFSSEVTSRYDRRLGRMTLGGSRHIYPLVAVYADRFVAERFALVGDAAVGMHPVTAHGFNFGLAGQRRLAKVIAEAAEQGRDIGELAVLRDYELAHKRATLPLYLFTNGTALLYTDRRSPARMLRGALIRAGRRAPPFRRAVSAFLTHVGA